MRALGLGLTLMLLADGPASALCRCVCDNGVLRTQCSGRLDPPAICGLICPLPARPQGSPPAAGGDLPQAGPDTAQGAPALLGATGLGR